jgi:trimethylamine--corrinoid protein Co-methyltransferase
MHIAGHPIEVMSPNEVATIHRNVLAILEKLGMQVQNDSLLHALADFGLPVDFTAQQVRFPPALVERFIAEAEKYDWERAVPTVEVTAPVYHSLYHDPSTGELVPWTEERLQNYYALARSLPDVDGGELLGCRFPLEQELEPLYERYYAWKYGVEESGSIHTDELCPYLLEIYQVYAAGQGKSLAEVFRGSVYLAPPLKLGIHEAYQVDYFRQRGLRVTIGSMHALGSSAPVTLAGAVTLNLAEQLALRILDWALFGVKRLHLGGSIAVLDMRTTSYRAAPVERPIANLMNAQLARFYGASYRGHADLTDAKLPSVEAGAQKALNAVPLMLAGGNLWLPVGLLSADQVCSPIQMVLDHELVGALKRFLHEFEVTDESIGLETILEAGVGGQFFDKEHTAHHFRGEVWSPKVWQRTMLQPWIESGSHLDFDTAREMVLMVDKGIETENPSCLPLIAEKAIKGIIARAQANL